MTARDQEKKQYTKLARCVQRRRAHLMDDLCRLVSIDTVNEGVIRGKANCRHKGQAFAFMLALARRMGLSARMIADRGLVVEYGSVGDVVAVPCHLDVVHAGADWKRPPFRATRERGRIYGRGSSDNKGPCLSALYALCALKECGISPHKKIRLIYCCDEESGIWTDMTYCLRALGQPYFAIVQDSYFPVVNSEKGFLDAVVTSRGRAGKTRDADGKILHFSGGLRSNMVPERAIVVLKYLGKYLGKYPGQRDVLKICRMFRKRHGHARLCVYAFQDYIKKTNRKDLPKGDYVVEACGKTAHGSLPTQGHNAVTDLAMCLQSLPCVDDKRSRLLRWIGTMIRKDVTGRCFGIQTRHPTMGPLTVNLGHVIDDAKGLRMILNIRYPMGITSGRILQAIQKTCPFPATVAKAPNALEPFLIDAKQKPIRQLARAYTLATGKKARMTSMAGSTYAKLFRRAAGFGPLMMHEKSTWHMPDEWISESVMLRNTKALAAAYLTIACSP